MNYQALYRKWRPTTFSDIVGQNHITQTLKNAVKRGHIAHAFLFAGPRGVGKTSAARILAKAVNCKSMEDGNPCNECDICLNINNGRSLDITEIDAASNNSVDEIRELREKVKYAPMESDYKVYIVDEVHMLSTAAFNALLKTLEEPPKHVIFILATTEAHKIPATIKSRCQRFDFHRIKNNDIVNHLEFIANRMNVNAEQKALSLIARAADGSLRDAISIFDQCLSFNNELLSLENVTDLLGAVDDSVFYELTEKLEDHKINEVLDIVGQQYYEGRSMEQLLIDYLHYLRNLLLLKNKVDKEIVSFNLDKMQKQADKLSLGNMYQLIHNIIEATNEVKYAQNQRLVVELALIEYENIIRNDYSSLITRIENLEKRTNNITTDPESVSQEVIITKDILKDRIKPKVEKSNKNKKDSKKHIRNYTKNTESSKDLEKKEVKEENLRKTKENIELNTMVFNNMWDEILDNVKKEDVITHALLNNAKPGQFSNNTLSLLFTNQFHYDQIIDSTKRVIVERVLNDMYNTRVEIKGRITNKKPEKSEKLEKEDVVQKALDIFNGKVVKE